MSAIRTSLTLLKLKSHFENVTNSFTEVHAAKSRIVNVQIALCMVALFIVDFTCEYSEIFDDNSKKGAKQIA
jgi:hypothetical protein